MHEVTKSHGAKIARIENCTSAQNCAKIFWHEINLHEGTKLQEGTKLHEDYFARRDYFARVKIWHEGSILLGDDFALN